MNKIIHLLVLSFLFVMALEAQEKHSRQPNDTIWTKIPSPMAATVRSLSESAEHILFAGTTSGLFRSENNGATWRDAGLTGKCVDKIFITSKGSMLAGCYREGMFSSFDKGKTWKSVGFEKNVYLFTIVQDSNNALFAAAAYRTTSPTPIPTGIFKSIDDGKTWQQTELRDSGIFSISIPRHGLIIASGPRGSYRSTDEGMSWSLLKHSGLPDSIPISSIIKVNSSFVASVGNRQDASSQSGGGIFRSDDEGITWMRSDIGIKPNTKVNNICIYKNKLLASTGFFTSVGDEGVFQSVDGGKSWTRLGLNEIIIREVRVTSNNQIIAATAENAIFVSADNGKSWNQIGKGIDEWETYKVQTNKNRIFAGSFAGSWRTSNDGASWKKIDKLGFDFVITKSGRMLTFGNGEMLASDDNGDNWYKVADIKGDYAFVHILQDNTIVACIQKGGGVWYSNDEGKSWKKYVVQGFENMDMRLVSSTPTGTLLMSGNNDMILLRSSDHGKSWSKVSGMTSIVWTISYVGATIYAGTYANGVYKSTDDGLTWDFFNEGLRKQDEYVTVTWLTAGKDNSIVCSTLGKGMWILRKDSKSWQPYNEGLGQQHDFWTSYNDDNKKIYVAGPGIFVRQIR